MTRRVGCIALILFASCIFAAGCEEKAECGNGIIEGEEQCDKNLGGTTCRDLGHDRGLLACTFRCTYDESKCIDCGNGVAEDGEVCDGADLDGYNCGHFGFTGGDLACMEDCTFDKSGCHSWPPLTIRVWELTADPEMQLTVEGATVALDAPSGERFEQVTSDNGRVTFENIDWSAGQTSITVYKNGYMMLSILDIDTSNTDQGLPVYLPKMASDQPESVTISGTITGMTDPAHMLVVNVLNAPVATEWQGNGSQTFTVTVPRGQRFTLQALEITAENLPSGQGYAITVYKVMHRDFEPVDANTGGVALNLPLHQVPTYTADTWVLLPQRADSPLRTGSAACWVFDSRSSYSIGWAAHVDISADGNQFDATLLWTQPTWSQSVETVCQVSDSGEMGASVVYVEGYPQPGELETLLDLPRWVAPSNPGVPHPISENLEWELFDTPDYTRLYVTRDGRAIWTVIGGHGSTSLSIPALPSSVASADFLGSAPLPAYLQVACVDEDYTRIERLAQAQMILLAP